MAGVLLFEDFLGGPDQGRVESIFPSTQKTYTYDFDTNVSGYSYQLDHQTLIVDTVTFVRATGEPNFDGSKVIGYFPKVELDVEDYVNHDQAASGIVYVTIPAGLYTGPIVPDARKFVPITIVGFTWGTPAGQLLPPTIQTHRWIYINSWEPDVVPGDPTTDPDYISIASI
jgi:hypothetical protein